MGGSFLGEEVRLSSYNIFHKKSLCIYLKTMHDMCMYVCSLEMNWLIICSNTSMPFTILSMSSLKQIENEPVLYVHSFSSMVKLN